MLDLAEKFKIRILNETGRCFLCLKDNVLSENNTVIDYQIEMILNNPPDYIIPFEITRKDNNNMYYYDITSLTPLSSRIVNNRIKAGKLLDFLSSLVDKLISSRNLLLYERNFVLNEEFIYMDNSERLKLIYIPVQTEYCMEKNLRNLILRLFSKTSYTTREGDEQLYNITRLVKTEKFSLTSLAELIENSENTMKNRYVQENSGFENEKNKETDKPVKTLKQIPVIPAVICQVVIILLSILVEKYLKSLGTGPAERYIPITVIVFVIDFILYKYFTQKTQDTPKIGTSKTGNSMIRFNRDKNSTVVTNIPADLPDKSDISDKSDVSDKSANMVSDSLSGETTLLDNKRETAFLVYEKGSKLIKTEITSDNLIIGRKKDIADMVILKQSIGRIHAEIVRRGSDFYLLDNNSKNGTFINSMKIQSGREYKLKNGDSIAFANIEYTFIK